MRARHSKWCGCSTCGSDRRLDEIRARVRRRVRRARRGSSQSRRIHRQRLLQAERRLQRQIRRCPPVLDFLLDQLGGNCPVQGTAYLTGPHGPAFGYFRARGETWSVEIWDGDHDEASIVGLDPDWFHDERYGTWPDAGWMPWETAVVLFRSACVRWAAGAPR